MKQALLTVVIGMIAAWLVPQALAQSISISPYLGLNFHPKMFITSIPGGVCVMKEIKNRPISLGIEQNGGTYYSPFAILSTNKARAGFYSGFGAQALLFVATRNIPKEDGSGDEKFNHFFGPILGIAAGPALITDGSGIGGATKVFLQGNYSFGKKGNFGLFAQTYLNLLFTKHITGYVLYSPAIVVGCKFTIR